jgi:hypothetical protein
MRLSIFNINLWVRISLLNFFVVALAGIILRYKINFSLPIIDQKYLLHGHSHFAFVGWVSLSLMALMIFYLQKNEVNINLKKYKWVLLANTITAYGMLLTFTWQGYAFFSITFSTLSIFVSYIFIYFYWQDLKKIRDTESIHIWFKTGLIIWAVSSVGAFSLAYFMASHLKNQDLYFAAIYFFLHFQYNGWFIFVCFGLLFAYLKQRRCLSIISINKNIYLLLVITVVPTYFLSIIWLKIPPYLYWVAAVAGFIQLLIIIYLISLLKKFISLRLDISSTTAFLWSLACVSLFLKIVLQSLSAVPYLAQFAFSYRPIVIGYLHLSFLGIISFFILGYLNEVLKERSLQLNKIGAGVFVFGVVFQEIILMSQGLEVINQQGIPYAGKLLFMAAIIMGIGLFLLAFKFRQMIDINKKPVTN